LCFQLNTKVSLQALGGFAIGAVCSASISICGYDSIGIEPTVDEVVQLASAALNVNCLVWSICACTANPLRLALQVSKQLLGSCGNNKEFKIR
jgi:aconitase B